MGGVRRMQEENIDLSGQVGGNLREIRKSKRMSLEELANVSNVSKLTLGKIERGKRIRLSIFFGKFVEGLIFRLSLYYLLKKI